MHYLDGKKELSETLLFFLYLSIYGLIPNFYINQLFDPHFNVLLINIYFIFFRFINNKYLSYLFIYQQKYLFFHHNKKYCLCTIMMKMKEKENYVINCCSQMKEMLTMNFVTN